MCLPCLVIFLIVGECILPVTHVLPQIGRRPIACGTDTVRPESLQLELSGGAALRAVVDTWLFGGGAHGIYGIVIHIRHGPSSAGDTTSGSLERWMETGNSTCSGATASRSLLLMR